jgi:hypothetical protein
MKKMKGRGQSKGPSGTRRGVSGFAVLVILMIILGAAGVYLIYQQSLAPKAIISIFLGQYCSPVKFVVTNQDSRILHGWTATLSVSPSDSQVSVNPASAAVIPLAPQGSYTGSFSISFGGAPPGIYQLKANLLNGTSTIATSNTLQCQVQ